MLRSSIDRLVRSLRKFRSLHKWIGVVLGVFMVIMAITGLVLGWKKNVDILQPPTREGQSSNMNEWIGFQAVADNAIKAMESVGIYGAIIDRMDVRPKDGIIKVQFDQGYWEAQVDATTGGVLSLGRRHADWIEKVHDGSIVTDTFKLLYTNATGAGLTVLALSGMWLWLGPRLVRRWKALRNTR